MRTASLSSGDTNLASNVLREQNAMSPSKSRHQYFLCGLMQWATKASPPPWICDLLGVIRRVRNCQLDPIICYLVHRSSCHALLKLAWRGITEAFPASVGACRSMIRVCRLRSLFPHDVPNATSSKAFFNCCNCGDHVSMDPDLTCHTRT